MMPERLEEGLCVKGLRAMMRRSVVESLEELVVWKAVMQEAPLPQVGCVQSLEGKNKIRCGILQSRYVQQLFQSEAAVGRRHQSWSIS